ncbi:MAG: hypothetical protein JXA28_00255 [Bacteroidetes bacterium]|nr:hypothetical protein [Bacteroidota bacterium]
MIVRIMTMLVGLTFLLAGVSIADTVSPQRSDSGKTVKAEDVYVYYFHSSRRCKTCLSIERISRGIIKDQYAETKRVVFKSINIEKDANKGLVEKYKIAGSSLLVCSGKEKVDLTAKAFQYALSSPDKLQESLISAVDKMLK